MEATVPVDSTETVKAILASAKKEFLEKGFANASLRTIAKEAGLTTGALYRHFADKEALFKSIVEPVYTEFLEITEEQAAHYLQSLKAGGIAAMTEITSQIAELFLGYVYEHFDSFKLLLSASEQTAYADFVDRLVQTEVEMTAQYLAAVRRSGYKIRKLSRQELRIIIRGQYSVLFEMVLHDVPKKLVLGYVKTISGFFSGGWQQILKQES
ncbi:TetR/AcrR family transcriptional regulator [Treponema phagedenis]|uniref:TetR/AcrR family transcriptional regulator n=1 Tax=Treponema phagedenis TaxID=162 RepID=A0AAE6IWW8_TREPH|nr:TetR/AcrR family transcriptional regulator [Treponema phagedenis]QEJ99521.1 TetR/AcrR family transcriptional regulator [Treponema phagedenis]QEK05092.1 TetR/AcrR family transcriptional regulator [Treponema phagedenis]QEK10714.1 TetR/AcrR family transcriptional regulator [Treponema phagedenis]